MESNPIVRTDEVKITCVLGNIWYKRKISEKGTSGCCQNERILFLLNYNYKKKNDFQMSENNDYRKIDRRNLTWKYFFGFSGDFDDALIISSVKRFLGRGNSVKYIYTHHTIIIIILNNDFLLMINYNMATYFLNYKLSKTRRFVFNKKIWMCNMS